MFSPRFFEAKACSFSTFTTCPSMYTVEILSVCKGRISDGHHQNGFRAAQSEIPLSPPERAFSCLLYPSIPITLIIAVS